MLDKVCINEDLDIDNQCLIIIPAYNEENSIFKVLEDVSKYFSNILVIDDGSSDNTVKKILDFKKCNLLRHFINCGQGISILTGIRFFLKKSNTVIDVF